MQTRIQVVLSTLLLAFFARSAAGQDRLTGGRIASLRGIGIDDAR